MVPLIILTPSHPDSTSSSSSGSSRLLTSSSSSLHPGIEGGGIRRPVFEGSTVQTDSTDGKLGHWRARLSRLTLTLLDSFRLLRPDRL
ncbi:hypothetical protein HRG_014072 [Hirsutella rhossiliensis]